MFPAYNLQHLVIDLHQTTSVSEHGKLKPLVSCWLGIQVALDVVIAGEFAMAQVLTDLVMASDLSLGFSILWLHRQRAGTSSKTTSVVDRLIHVSFQAGIVPLFFALAGLISFGENGSPLPSIFYFKKIRSCSTRFKSLHHIRNTDGAHLYNGVFPFPARSSNVN